MKKSAFLLALIVACGLGIPIALGWGGTHPKGRKVGGNSGWTDGVKDLVNGTEWTRGWWVNANDYFCYQGDTATLNAFIEKYSRLQGLPLTVILHPGRGMNRGIAGDEEAETMDWQLRVLTRGRADAEAPAKTEKDQSGIVVNVHVWLGDNVDLARLTVPPNVNVKSGGEIEGFIAKHEKGQAQSAPASQPATRPAR